MKPYRYAALVMAIVFAAIAWAAALLLRWQPRAGFDVLGCGWLLMNLPKVMIVAIPAFIAFVALSIALSPRP